MATIDGAPTPPQLSDTSSGSTKRKRSSSAASPQPNGASRSQTSTFERNLQPVLEDILEVLKRYDTKPSILDLPITPKRSVSAEPSTKRAKLAHDEGVTIAKLVGEGSYTSFTALQEDVETAASDILASFKSKEGAPASLNDTRVITGVLAFKKVLRNMISRETHRASVPAAKDAAADEVKTAPDSANEPSNVGSEAEDGQEGQTVLTLYGQAPVPKQLFSSLQQPSRVSTAGSESANHLDTSIKVTLPLAESYLPNIISTTKIFPTHIEETDSKKKTGATFGELFAPPVHIPQLSPPKPAKQLTTRGTTVSFVHQTSLPKPSRKGPHPYTTQALSTGQWLGYSGVDGPKEPSSPTAKQKNRQRALSTGEAQLPRSEATQTALKQAKEDALFRTAYSSFAPDRDDAIAVVPGETKNRVWWQRLGEKRFNETFGIDPALEDFAQATQTSDTSKEDELFREAVENFEPIEDSFTTGSWDRTDLEKDTDEVLQEISELLETLASHQRIRNSTLATNPRTPVVQNASLASLAGSPSNPSTEEIDVYQMLKSQLSLMIASLPPYAVAKLNGDQLAELNISRTVLVSTEDYRGVLEEDSVSRLAKATALTAVAGPVATPRMSSGAIPNQSHYAASGVQYPRTASSSHGPTPRSSQGSQSFYGQQPVHRSPSMHYPRSNSSSQQYTTPASYSNSTQRPSYQPQQMYGQQTPRPSYSQGTSGQYYSQRSAQPSNYGMSSSQYYQTPQAQTQARYTQPAQPNYQQRAPMYNNYSSSQSPHVGTGSPLKANQPPKQPSYPATHSSYTNSAPNAQMRGGGYFNQANPQQASQYGSPQVGTPSAGGVGGYPSSASSDQQQILSDRQRALAMQAQARVGSGTPQPGNGQLANGQQQVNGTPMVA